MIHGGEQRDGRRSRPGGWPLVASIVVHAAAVVALWSASLAAPPPLPAFKVYEVKIVSPPPKEAGTPEPVVVNAPKVTKPEPQPQPRPAEPKPQPPKAETPKVETPPKSEPSRTTTVKEEPKKPSPATTPAGPKPDPKTREAGEGIDVRIEGEAFPFPGYLENIQLQISRYFRWTGRTGLEAEIYFVIRRDGTIEDMRLVRGSGDASFNFEAMAAIEQAGRRAAFGPLPEEFTGDRLPVLFYFRPAR